MFENQCPLQKLKVRIFSNSKNNYRLNKIEKKINTEIKNAFDFAKKAKFPKKNILNQFIYSS